MPDEEEMELKCKGGGNIINSASMFSFDGQFIYVPWKNFIRSYSLESGQKVADFEGCDNDIIGVKIHPGNSSLLVGCSSTGEIAIWKWQAQLLLISVNKLKAKIIRVISFDLLKSDDDGENNECDILLCWEDSESNSVGIFSLKTLKQKSTVNVHVASSVLAISVGNLSNSPYVAYVDSKNLVCATVCDGKIVNHKLGKQKKFTCVAAHPEENCVATGDDMGRVVLWNNLFGRVTRAVYHWHTLPVNTLAFSPTGSVLYSGGNECVLVKWRLNTLSKDFLPRLPAPIVYLFIAPGNVHIAAVTRDNAIYVINSQFRIKCVVHHMTWSATMSVGLRVDGRTKSLVMNGHVGNVQFYSPHTMSLLYNLDIVGQNKLTEERNEHLPNTNVSKVAISSSGNWLACIEDRREDEIYREIRLKFFEFDTNTQSYKLNTCVEFPHDNGVGSLEFQPITDSLCATTGNDNQFKIWNLVDTSDIYRKGKSWHCLSTGNYKNLPISALSFSMDGSLLAAAFGHCLTAWSPETCEFKCSLAHMKCRAPLLAVQFGNLDQAHLVVVASAERLFVWNLLTLSLMWMVEVNVKHICADPLTSYMALFTVDDELFVFSPGSSTPLCYRKKLNNKIICATFLPRVSESSQDVQWQRFSQLHFIDENQELLCLESRKVVENNNAIEFTSQVQKTAFGALAASSMISSVGQQKNHISELDNMAFAEATEMKQLLNPPVHTMAPLRLVCKPVLQSLIAKGDKFESFTTIDEADSEPNEQEKTVIVSKSNKQTSKKKNQNLQSIFTEPLEWISVLLD